MGKVVYPPLRSFDAGLSEARQQQLQGYVMKISKRAQALHCVAVAQRIRSRWPMICRPPRVPRAEPVESALRREWARLGPDAFFALPLDRVCNRIADAHQPWRPRTEQQQGDSVGIYMPHAGRPWPERFPHAAAHVAGQKVYSATKPPFLGIDAEGLHFASHILLGILALHRAGVTHNDLHSHNLLLDEHGTARWCDFDNAVVEREEEGDGSVCDCLPPDARIYTALMDSPVHVFLYGAWVRDRPTHVARDWRWVADLLATTWPVDPKSPDRRWNHAVDALRQFNDQAARLAWTIIRNASSRAQTRKPHLSAQAGPLANTLHLDLLRKEPRSSHNDTKEARFSQMNTLCASETGTMEKRSHAK
jgi:hypothetical protein